MSELQLQLLIAFIKHLIDIFWGNYPGFVD